MGPKPQYTLEERGELVYKTLLALADEFTSDPDLVLLGSAGLGLASRSRLLKGMGIALAGLYITRRADTYVTEICSKMHLLAQVIDAGNPKEVNEQETRDRAEG